MCETALQQRPGFPKALPRRREAPNRLLLGTQCVCNFHHSRDNTTGYQTSAQHRQLTKTSDFDNLLLSSQQPRKAIVNITVTPFQIIPCPSATQRTAAGAKIAFPISWPRELCSFPYTTAASQMQPFPSPPLLDKALSPS